MSLPYATEGNARKIAEQIVKEELLEVKEKYIKSLTENGYTKEEEAAILKAAEDQGEDISFERYLKYYGGNKWVNYIKK